MKVAAPELLGRKPSLSDAATDEDARDRGPHFELALAHIREQALSADCDEQGDELSSSRDRQLSQERRRSADRLDADAMSEDQVLSATANNPVLAALAAVRAWQAPKPESAPTRADGFATAIAAGSVLEAVAARASSAYMPPAATGDADVGNASNRRQAAVSLTLDQPDHAVSLAAKDSTGGGSHAPTNDDSDAHEVASLDLEAEVKALISAANHDVFVPATTARAPATETGPGANVPTLPPATAQRLIDGTVAALRIDRDTANPQHSASIIEVRHPELGVVKAEVRLIGDVMEVRFEAGSAAATLLRASESLLRKAVSQHGLRLRNLQIDSRSTLMQERSRRARRHLLDLEA